MLCMGRQPVFQPPSHYSAIPKRYAVRLSKRRSKIKGGSDALSFLAELMQGFKNVNIYQPILMYFFDISHTCKRLSRVSAIASQLIAPGENSAVPHIPRFDAAGNWTEKAVPQSFCVVVICCPCFIMFHLIFFASEACRCGRWTHCSSMAAMICIEGFALNMPEVQKTVDYWLCVCLCFCFCLCFCPCPFRYVRFM